MRFLVAAVMLVACSSGDAARIEKLEKKVAALDGMDELNGKEIVKLLGRDDVGAWWCPEDPQDNAYDPKVSFMGYMCSRDHAFCLHEFHNCATRRIAYCTNDGGGECFSNIDSCTQVIKFDGALATKNTFCIGVE